MTEYKQYVEAVNKIFEYITIMKQDWPNPDNISYLENIEQYKQVVIDSASLFSDKKVVTSSLPQNDVSMEELGNDWKFNVWTNLIRF